MNNNLPPDKPVTTRKPFLGSLSLRAKLILANMLIIGLAVGGTGFYVYSRGSQANSFISSQLDKNILKQAEDNLNNTCASQEANLNTFFAFMRREITTVGTTSSNLLSQEVSLSGGTYWNAFQALSRLPNGSWDNTNAEASSVFVPAKKDLTPDLVSEINTIKKLDLTVPAILKENPDAVAIYFGGQPGETIYYPNIDLAAIVPPDFDVTSRPWYTKASPQQDPAKNAVWSDPYLDAALHGLIVTTSMPVYDSAGNFRGVTAMDIQLNRITDIVSNIRVGKTGYAMLVDRDKRLIALPETGYRDLGITSPNVPLGNVLEPSKLTSIPAELFSVLENTASGKSGLQKITIGKVERFVAYQPIPEVGYGIVVIVPSSELLSDAIAARQQMIQESISTLSSSILLVFVILVIALIVTLLIGNGLTQPLQALTRTAEEITHGNLTAEARVRGQDEVGILANAINSMTSSLRQMILSLEQQVQERTADLVRKTQYQQAAARIAHDAAELQAINTLLKQTTDLISNRFGFYHTGIFLLEEAGKYAVLMAASSEGGQRMLARGHRLAVGIQGIVGAAAYQNQARVVMNVEEDKNYYQNPDLPLTRSEAAFPLAARGKVLGVLDIQSIELAAFQPDEVEILQTMADQIGLAIQNTRLISESQDAIKRLETTTTESTYRTWRERAQGTNRAYRYTSMGLMTTLQQGKKPSVGGNYNNELNVPINLRGQHLGTIVLRRSPDNIWSESDRSLAAGIAGQVGLALENARLLDDAQRRAAQESSLSDLSTKLSSSLDPDTLLKTVIQELHQIPNVSGVSVYLNPSEKTSGKE